MYMQRTCTLNLWGHKSSRWRGVLVGERDIFLNDVNTSVPHKVRSLSYCSGMSIHNNEALQKRKHKTLSIQEKVQLLELLESGTSVKRLCNIFNVGSSTVYDIKRKKEALLRFYEERQSKKGAPLRKTMKEGKCNDIERALVEWFELRRSEGVTVTGGMLVEQAKILQKELKPNFECKYSQGWLEKFKNRHGIKLYTIDDEKLAADSDPNFSLAEATSFVSNEELILPNDSDVVDNFIKKFTDTVGSEDFHSEQIYSASETTLFWRQMPKDIFTSEQDNASHELQDFEDRIAVFNCFNATGSHRCKSLVVSKSPKPKAFNGVKVLPVIYRTSERICVTREIMIDWLENHFTAEARTHCTSLGFAEDCKVLLILDSNLAPSNEEILIIDNVYVLFLPSNYSVCIQPQHQGITQWLKCWYRLECMAGFLEAIIQGKSAENFRSEFNTKVAMWALARAWENISEIAFRRSWHKLWPDLMYDDLSEKDIAEVYICYKQQIINPIVDYVKSINSNLAKYICYENLEEWIEVGAKISCGDVQSEQINQVRKIGIKKENENETDESEETTTTSIEDCIRLTTELISGLEKQNFIAEHEIMYLYRLKANIIAEKFKNQKSVGKEDSKCAPPKKKRKTSMLETSEN